MKQLAAFVALASLTTIAARSDADCVGFSADLSRRAAGSDWSVPATGCMSSTSPPPDVPQPMVVTREKINLTGGAPGRSPSHSHPAGGDPVLGDGEFFEQRVDASLAALGPHFEFKRTYRSRVNSHSPLGYNWDHSYDKRVLGQYQNAGGIEYISPTCDDSLDYQDGELNVVHFTRDPSTTAARYVAPSVGLVLDYVSTGTGLNTPLDFRWQIHQPDGRRLIFDTTGHLSQIVDPAGNQLAFVWEPSPVSSVDDAFYGPAKRLASASDGARTVHYLYQDSYQRSVLQCISLGTSCGDASSRPADVLAYFVHNALDELTTVLHGQSTFGEQYTYRDATALPSRAGTYWPSTCAPNATLEATCNRYCGAVDPANPATCGNLDVSAAVARYCGTLVCLDPNGPVDPHGPKCHAGPGNPPACCIANQGIATPDPICMRAYGMSPDCYSGCLQQHQCVRQSTSNAFYSFGVFDDLAHNIVDVYDQNNIRVVHNTYGELPWDVSFDRVISQQLGPDIDENNTVTFAYHDLNVEGGQFALHPPAGSGIDSGPFSAPDSKNVVSRGAYSENALCPKSACWIAPDGTCSIEQYGQPTLAGALGIDVPIPLNAVVIRDVHGVTRTQYYDAKWNLVREVNIDAGETTDYNYDLNGRLVAIQQPSGVRQCFERDTVGNTTQSTTLPVAGYSGSQLPVTTSYRFDAANQLTDVWADSFGTLSKTHYQRDASERVVYVDQDVLPGQTPIRTTYSYDEDPAPNGIRETPATERLPDGTVNTYRNIDPSLGGTRAITIDATSQTPEHRYTSYDARGRVIESGETDRYATQYAFDSSNHLGYVGHRLAAGSPWIQTRLLYRDNVGEKVSEVDEQQRYTLFQYLGQYPNVQWYSPLNASTGLGEVTQVSCLHYDADGRFEGKILPEGNEVRYEYDVAGRMTKQWKGFWNGAPRTAAWQSACSGRTAPIGDPGEVLIEGRIFGQGGFVSYVAQGDVWRKVTTDGFGRVIQSDTAFPSQVNVASHQIGYDSRGRAVWMADLNADNALPSTPYQKPTMTTTGLLSMTEFEYDFLDRRTAERRWVVQTGEVLSTTYAYDDQKHAVTTTDRGLVSTSQYDGRGRLSLRVLPDQSTEQVTHYLGYDVITRQTNQGTPLIRTIQYDTRGNATATLDENGTILSSAQYDDDGNRFQENRRGVGGITKTFDKFDRLYHTRQDLLNGQYRDEYFQWDTNNRLKQNHGWMFTYTGFDASLTVTDPLKRVEQYSYVTGMAENAGRIDATGRHFCYRYDYEMRLESIYDIDCPANAADVRGPLTPMLERRRFLYTPQGQLAHRFASFDAAHPEEQTIEYRYDSIGRETDERVDDGQLNVETYQVHHDFPDLGRTVVTQVSGQELQPPPVVIRLCGPPHWQHICPNPPLFPWAATFRQAYDGVGHLSAVDLNGTRMATWDYGTGAGGPRFLNYGNGTRATYSYDHRLRQSGIDVVLPIPSSGAALLRTTPPHSIPRCPPGVDCSGDGSIPTPIASLHDGFGADSVVRMRQRVFGTAAPLTDVYQIDGDSRITAENMQLADVPLPVGEVDDTTISSYLRSGGLWRYFDVDGDGNWRSVATQTAGSVAEQSDAIGRLESVGNQAMAIDPHDNLQGLAGDLQGLAGDQLKLTFDVFSQALLTASNGGLDYKYTYDAAGRRSTETASDGSSSVFIWDGNQLIAHGDPANLTIDVPGNDVDQHVASVEDNGSGRALYYHQGPDQSVFAISDSAGLVEGYSYSSYGDTTIWSSAGTRTPVSAVNNRFRFQGQLFDPGTGTYAMRARQYVPQWGRFASPDPLSYQAGPSLYSFTGSRPLAARDPLGLDTVVFCADPGSCGTGFGGSPIEAGFGFVSSVRAERGPDPGGWGRRNGIDVFGGERVGGYESRGVGPEVSSSGVIWVPGDTVYVNGRYGGTKPGYWMNLDPVNAAFFDEQSVSWIGQAGPPDRAGAHSWPPTYYGRPVRDTFHRYSGVENFILGVPKFVSTIASALSPLAIAAQIEGGPLILSGHGALIEEAGASPIVAIPEGTSVTVWSAHGEMISDVLGNAIETGGDIGFGNFGSEIEGARTYLPGSMMPDYTLLSGEDLTLMGNPFTVTSPTPLSSVLGPGMGNVQWAACCVVR